MVNKLKILSVADIHGSQYRLNILLKNIEKYNPDIVIICGDITQFGPRDVAINILNQINKPTFAIHGNIDTNEVIEAIDDSNATNIHLKKLVVNNFNIIGFGGEIQISNNLKIKVDKSYKTLDELLNESSIIVSHVPPFGLQDRIFLGLNSGSKNLRKIIDEYNPLLVLCGHIHENPGYMNYKKTTIVNCSIGKKGGGALIDLNNKIKVKMLD
jgi:Icc-related predicted phosphoesterase